MAYLVDRERALRLRDVVAIVKSAQPRLRTRVVLRDNSLHQTRTRAQTLVRYSRNPTAALGRAPR